jgi:hypothetical protein
MGYLLKEQSNPLYNWFYDKVPSGYVRVPTIGWLTLADDRKENVG